MDGYFVTMAFFRTTDHNDSAVGSPAVGLSPINRLVNGQFVTCGILEL